MMAALFASSDEMFRNLQTLDEEDVSIDQQLKNTKTFVKEVSSDLDYYCLNFYNFFNIPQELYALLGNE